MTETFEFELVFALQDKGLDPVELSNAVFAAGFEEALVGTGIPGLMSVEITLDGEDAETVILDAARKVLKFLPSGTALREVRPDLVSLADLAARLNINRQALQQRRMPYPSLGGLYRVEELAEVLQEVEHPKPGSRRPRFDIQAARGWLRAGIGARRVNALLRARELDTVSLEPIHHKKAG